MRITSKKIREITDLLQAVDPHGVDEAPSGTVEHDRMEVMTGTNKQTGTVRDLRNRRPGQRRREMNVGSAFRLLVMDRARARVDADDKVRRIFPAFF